jgi:hypothetical protein
VPVVHLLVGFTTGDDNFFGVDDDDVGARVHRGGVQGLVLAAQHSRDERRQPAQGRALGVDDVPPLGSLEGVAGARVVGLVPKVGSEVGGGGSCRCGDDRGGVGGRCDGDWRGSEGLRKEREKR